MAAQQQKGIRVLSLCDGMSGGQIALKEIGIPVKTYYASEIKKHAIYVTQKNFPETIQIGDVMGFIKGEKDNKYIVDEEKLDKLGKIDLFLCGSPCKNMSSMNITGKTGIKGEKSSLFYACVAIMKYINPKYFLFENVYSMTNADKKEFNDYLGVTPVHINSALVSAQERNRYYWTNIADISQPKDKKIVLQDIIEWGSEPEEKWTEKKKEFVKTNKTIYTRIDGEKSLPITARGYAAWNTQFITDGGNVRDLTTKEYRRLQTIPDWYDFGDLIKTKITDLIGDGWTIEVIKHILGNITMEEHMGGKNMAAGFSVKDELNKNSKAGIDESPKARFRTKDISIFKMYRNDMNFYSVEQIEELAGDILMYGMKQNLELVYAPCEKGEYRIVAGERRWEALKFLVSKGYKEFEIATSKLTAPQDEDEEQVEIIIANAYRVKTITDMIEEETRLKASLERMKAAGKKIKGYDLQSGRLRDVIASMLHMSKTKVAQIEAVNNNLIPEWKEELKSERLTFSAAYELSGMSADEQREALGIFMESGELTHKTIKDMKEAKAAGAEMAAGQQVSESGTEEKEDAAGFGGMNPPEEHPAAGGDYQTPHPEGITSLCYSCTEYETCNVKTGTCTKCDQYKNRAEAYKTDEQRYSEEQDAIDRETAKKLREKAQEEKMQNLPSDSQQSGQKVHQIRLGATFFDDVCSGKKSFELRKNDRGYKQGDILEMLEFADGKNTGRMVRVLVTYLLEDYTGLEDGYCIMATVLLSANGEPIDKATKQEEQENE